MSNERSPARSADRAQRPGSVTGSVTESGTDQTCDDLVYRTARAYLDALRAWDVDRFDDDPARIRTSAARLAGRLADLRVAVDRRGAEIDGPAREEGRR